MKKRNGKKLLAAILILTLLLNLNLITVFADGEDVVTTGTESKVNVPVFSGGDGSEMNPWLISNKEDLIVLAKFINEGNAAGFDATSSEVGNFNGYFFKQTADIDLSGLEWEPIGYSGNEYFAGNYNGGNSYITNASSKGKTDKDGYTTSGIFGWIAFGSVSNLHVANSNFTGTGKNKYSYAGGIAGVTYGATITNCSVIKSTIESKRDPSNNNCAGSLSGYSTGGTFKGCAARDNIVKATVYAGGFVGEVDDDNDAGNSSFTDCYVANSTVTASSANVQDTNVAGGFAGEMTATVLTIRNCFVYNTSIQIDVNSQSNTKFFGVFAGNLWGNSEVEDTNCFYDEGTGNIGNAMQKTDEEFKNKALAELLGNSFVKGIDCPILASAPADYTAVDVAIAKIPSDLTNYTSDSVQALENATTAVIRGKIAMEQEIVNGYAATIEEAINNLVKKSIPPILLPDPEAPKVETITKPDGSVVTTITQKNIETGVESKVEITKDTSGKIAATTEIGVPVNVETVENVTTAVVSEKVADRLVEQAKAAEKAATDAGATNINSIIIITVNTSSDATKVETLLPTGILNKIATETSAALKIVTSVGEVTLDGRALDEAAIKSDGQPVTLTIEKVDKTKLPEAIQDKLDDKTIVLDLTLSTPKGRISDFGKGSVTVSVEIPEDMGKKIKAMYINDKYEAKAVEGKAINIDGKSHYQFRTNHFSYYVLADGGTIDKEVNDTIKAGVKETKVFITSKSSKGKIVLKFSRTRGYLVDGYQLFKSNKKTSDFKSIGKTKGRTSYINTKNLKKGKRYYYKVRGYRNVNGTTVYTKFSGIVFRIAK